MRAIANFGMYGDESRIPEWIHAEKFEYCEDFYKEGSDKNSFLNTLRKLFVK